MNFKTKLELYGWALFIIGLLFWLVQAAILQDFFGVVGGMCWLAGCVMFVVVTWRNRQ